MQIRPILTALRHHCLAALLIALEVALACAVLCNACFLIVNRLDMMRIDSGVDESSLALLQLTGYEGSAAADLNARVLAGLRAIPGMQSVSVLSTVPFGPQVGWSGITIDTARKNYVATADFDVGGPGSIKALGLKLVAGHLPELADYQPLDNFVPADSRVLISRALADFLWPGEDPLGKEFWCVQFHFRVIGVLDHLAATHPDSHGMNSAGWSVFVPAQPGKFLSGSYVLRADPRELPRVLRDARAVIAKVAPDAVLDHSDSQTVSDLRYAYFQRDRAMTGMLVGVIVALLLVTTLGIMGLASFWVTQRNKQIGIRRAIGATRSDILHYFQIENFLIISFGIAMGMLLAYALNIVLMKFYEVPHLPLYYLPLSALTLWGLGQLAVLGPAMRAAAVPPVVATRSV